MYGSGMGALNVYLDSSAGRSLLLSEFGDHGDSWKTVHVDFESSKSYQVCGSGNYLFEGFWGFIELKKENQSGWLEKNGDLILKL